MEAEKIFYSYNKVMRSEYDRSNYVMSFKNFTNVQYVGCFYEQTLVCFLKVSLGDRLPTYQIGNMNIKKKFLQRYDFSNKQHPIIPMMDFILDQQERSNRYTWYYNRSLTPAYHKLQLEGKDLLRNCMLGWDNNKNQYRYERFIEEVVLAGNLPVYTGHHAIQNKIFDTDYMIVKCCLKNEYRHTLNYFDNQVITECLKNTPKIKNI